MGYRLYFILNLNSSVVPVTYTELKKFTQEPIINYNN